MKPIARKSEAQKISENGVSEFSEYPLDFKDFSVGVSEINGRYPQSGYDSDEEVEAIWYVESGSGTIFIAGETFEVAAGDMVKILAKEKYWINGKKLKLVVVSSPLWYREQHKHYEN